MTDWYMYDTTSGEIVRRGVCQDSDFEFLVAPVDATLAIGAVDDVSYVVDGIVASYSNTQWAAKQLRPPFRSSWSNQTMQWLDERTLEERRSDKWGRIKVERDLLSLAGISVAGNALASDPASQTKILLGVIQAQLNPTTFSEPWLLADGSVFTLNATQMKTVAKELYDHIKALDVRMHAAGVAITAATTIAEVEAVVL